MANHAFAAYVQQNQGQDGLQVLPNGGSVKFADLVVAKVQ